MRTVDAVNTIFSKIRKQNTLRIFVYEVNAYNFLNNDNNQYIQH